jgi:hypothetical protein
MDPVTLIVAALAAGAASGASETATTAIRDAYQGLKRLVSARFASRNSAEVALAEHETDPDTWEAPLARELHTTGADGDPAVIEAAQRLLTLLDSDGARAGKYTVDVRGAQGVQIGDNNRQFNQFSSPPRAQ